MSDPEDRDFFGRVAGGRAPAVAEPEVLEVVDRFVEALAYLNSLERIYGEGDLQFLPPARSKLCGHSRGSTDAQSEFVRRLLCV